MKKVNLMILVMMAAMTLLGKKMSAAEVDADVALSLAQQFVTNGRAGRLMPPEGTLRLAHV